MDVNKICRCCLTNDGPFQTIYDGGTTNKDSLAALINKITGIKADPNDKLPDKACRLCITEIKDFYEFKKKCKNSHRTLQQLFLSEVKVQLSSPMTNLQSEDATENEELKIVGKYQMSQTKVDNDFSRSVKFETDIKSVIPIDNVNKCMASSADKSISIPSSNIYLQNSYIPLENYKETSSSNTELTENPYKNEFPDSETDSCDSIEFISDKPKVNEPIVVLEEFNEAYNTNHNAEFNKETAVEYIFKHVSSPQWVPEEEIYLSIVNEDLNFDVESIEGGCYQCAICEQVFEIKNDLIHHLKTHENPYSCLFCENLFNDYSTLQMHLMEHYTTKSHEPTNSLIVGSTPFNQPKVKRLKLRNHACDICPKRFRVAYSLINHRRIHTGERPYKCKYCDKAFSQVSTRSSHEKTHTGEKRYKCQFCDKTFAQTGGRKIHERIHTGEKPFKCQFCNKGFIQLSVKARHEETHMRPNFGESGFKCKFCEKTFVKSEYCTAHEIVHTKEKPHKCQYCQRGFKSPIVKDRHEESHKKSVIKCPQCDITFIDASAVLEHFKTQHTQESHKRSVLKCPQCDITFIDPSDVFEHFKSLHT